MKIIHLVFLGLAVVTSGCAVVSSSDVNPSTIYSQYTAKYDEASSQLTFDAEFFVEGDTGTYVELDNKSSVTLDSRAMVEQKTFLNQIMYEDDSSVAPTALNPGYTFVFTGDDGKTYRNTLTIPARVNMTPPQLGAASVSSGFTLQWQTSSALGVNETVSATLTGSRGSAFESAYAGGTSGQIYFTPGDLKNFGAEPATLKICRQYYTSHIDGTAAGGNVSASYCATPVTIVLNL